MDQVIVPLPGEGLIPMSFRVGVVIRLCWRVEEEVTSPLKGLITYFQLNVCQAVEH